MLQAQELNWNLPNFYSKNRIYINHHSPWGITSGTFQPLRRNMHEITFSRCCPTPQSSTKRYAWRNPCNAWALQFEWFQALIVRPSMMVKNEVPRIGVFPNQKNDDCYSIWKNQTCFFSASWWCYWIMLLEIFSLKPMKVLFLKDDMDANPVVSWRKHHPGKTKKKCLKLEKHSGPCRKNKNTWRRNPTPLTCRPVGCCQWWFCSRDFLVWIGFTKGKSCLPTPVQPRINRLVQFNKKDFIEKGVLGGVEPNSESCITGA